MYDPSTARFLSKDPTGGKVGSPNLYLYCANDPVNRIDPSGNDEFWPSAPPWLVREGQALQNRVKDIVDALIEDKGPAERHGNEPFEEVLTIAREVATKAFLAALGVDPDELKQAFKDCTLNTEGLGEIGDERLDFGLGGVTGRVVEALEEAVKGIGENIGGYLLGGLEGWLEFPIRKLFEQSSAGSVSNLLFLLLDEKFGLTWEALLARFQASLGGDSDVLLYTFETLAKEKHLDRKPGASLNEWRTTWLAGSPDFAEVYQKAISATLKAVKAEVVQVLLEALFAAVLKNIFAAILGGALGTVFKAIVKIIKTGTNVASKICISLQALIDVFKVAIRGGTVEQIKPFAVKWLEASSPVLVALAASALDLDSLPKLLRKGMMKAERAVWKPVDVIVHFVGKHMNKLLDPIFGNLGLLEPGVSRPLTRAAVNDKHKDLGTVKLWVAKGDRKPKLKASPESDVEHLLTSGLGVRKLECLSKVHRKEFSTIGPASTNLVTTLSKKPFTQQDAAGIPKLTQDVYSIEQSLLDAILGCGSVRGALDPCDLAGLNETTDKYWNNRPALTDPSTAYQRRNVQAMNQYGSSILYPVVDQLIALVGYVQYGVNGVPKNANKSQSGPARLYTSKCVLKNYGTDTGQYDFVVQPDNPGCYFQRPTVGYPGKPTAGLVLPGGRVPPEYCDPPGHPRDTRSGCPATGRTEGNPNCRDQVGHVLAREFGGDAKSETCGNIFPHAGAANRALGTFEYDRIVVPHLSGSTKRRVCIRIQFRFGNAKYPYRPVRLNYEWWLDRLKQPGPSDDALDNPDGY